MKKEASNLTAEQQAELTALTALPDDQIDTRDVPEQKDWTGAQRGLFASNPDCLIAGKP